MPRSQADPAADPGRTLDALARCYDEALSAASGGDLDGCARLLDAGDQLLAAAQPAIASATRPPELEPLLQQAATAHARLVAVLASLQQETGQELARVRSGQRALAGYGGERRTGDRVRTDA